MHLAIRPALLYRCALDLVLLYVSLCLVHVLVMLGAIYTCIVSCTVNLQAAWSLALEGQPASGMMFQYACVAAAVAV